jgi:hypothetical protein
MIFRRSNTKRDPAGARETGASPVHVYSSVALVGVMSSRDINLLGSDNPRACYRQNAQGTAKGVPPSWPMSDSQRRRS